ncbi:MAG: hypothetical protein WDM89_19185 [Rhizomicrobium sp.]
MGRNFALGFEPELTPKEMLELGIFGGKYMTDCKKEFPANWFARAKLSPRRKTPALNYFGVDASQPLSYWKRKGWIHDDDPRGWFPMVLPLHHGPPPRGRRAPDQALETDDAPHRAAQEALRTRRSALPPAPAPGAAALGLR